MEMFTRRMVKASGCKGFFFHPRCKQLKLTTLAFADDLLIFCKPMKSSLKIVKDELYSFANELRLIANPTKMCMFFGGVDVARRRDLNNFMGFQTGRLPVRYLGVPLHSKKLKHGDF